MLLPKKRTVSPTDQKTVTLLYLPSFLSLLPTKDAVCETARERDSQSTRIAAAAADRAAADGVSCKAEVLGPL